MSLFKQEATLEDINRNQGFDWPEVFKYAVNPESVDGLASRETFIASEVVKIIGAANGENDGQPWIMLGQLADERYFLLTAWCDYTGWGCREAGKAYVALDPNPLLSKMSDEEFDHFCRRPTRDEATI